MADLTLFRDLYQSLNSENLNLLDEVYSENIAFTDPLHSIDGIDNLKRYFAQMYENAGGVTFEFLKETLQDNEAFISWRMHFTHPRLNRGRDILVEGASIIRFDAHGKIDYHRDYYDAGSLLYEHIPILGTVIKTIKSRLNK